MTYHQTFTRQPCPNLSHVREFLNDHGTALAKVAHKLGGPAACARASVLYENLRNTLRLTRAQSNQLFDFHCLLTLEHVDDPDRTESYLFTQINLAYGFVDECCFLSDNLRGLLNPIAEDEPNSDIRCKASRAIPQVA